VEEQARAHYGPRRVDAVMHEALSLLETPRDKRKTHNASLWVLPRRALWNAKG
jgi:hypothetical protein